MVMWQNTNISEDLPASIFRVKVEAAASEMLVSYHIIMLYHSPEDNLNLFYHC
jgi:hypothetical protein